MTIPSASKASGMTFACLVVTDSEKYRHTDIQTYRHTDILTDLT